ncbi:MAG TPA: YtxH domain-containing protein [Nocardioides sp.]|nr:YtxH domain-containing protein [Nocardioides sp.]
MAGKFSFLVGFGAGYVLGARSGRERYDQIASKAQEVWRDPRVQEKAGQAQQLVKEKASVASSVAAEKASEAGSKVSAKVGASTTASSSAARTRSGRSGGTSS